MKFRNSPPPPPPHGPQGPHDHHHGHHPHGHHPPGHHRPGHHPHERRDVGGFWDRLNRLKRMGATAEDLHEVIESEISGASDRAFQERIGAVDPGRTKNGVTVDPLVRARVLDGEFDRASGEFFQSLAAKTILVAGEFPHHVIESVLHLGANVVQIHPPTPHGHTPPHFEDLAESGFTGITHFEELDNTTFDVVLFEGCVKGDELYVSALVKIALRLFPNCQVAVLEVHHRAPHMVVTIPGSGLFRLPFAM